ADDSVAVCHAKVGNCQALKLKTQAQTLGFFFDRNLGKITRRRTGLIVFRCIKQHQIIKEWLNKVFCFSFFVLSEKTSINNAKFHSEACCRI
ncbi:MAG: hypothetical protein Q8L79_09145, partial [Methylobacter sp.]|uniref:hypothetical protein n=1 Tax=Methylobacter sp. TaxID=2051955 RepID=UPI0027301A46